MTTFHWHGLEIPGPIEDGGCHAPVYPGEARDVTFKIIQPAATAWLHAHPCPETAYQVWQGLATMAIIHDQEEASLPLPHTYGVDDLPLILQDRNFHAGNQFDYRADYDPDGVQGDTAVINATVNPYFDVTTQRLRLRILNGSNRREYRLHFLGRLNLHPNWLGPELFAPPGQVKEADDYLCRAPGDRGRLCRLPAGRHGYPVLRRQSAGRVPDPRVYAGRRGVAHHPDQD